MVKIFEVRCDICDKTKPFLAEEDQIKKIVSASHRDKSNRDCYGKLSYSEIEIEYIMKTYWRGHWDALDNDETYYTRSKIKIGIPIEGIARRKESAETIFLKRKDENSLKAEKAWKGSVKNFNIREGTTLEGKKYPQLWFEVHIDGEIVVPEEYNDFRDGDGWTKVVPKIDKEQTNIEDAWGTM